jgi:hypothetical protein
MVFNLAIEKGLDDDGNAASGIATAEKPKISAAKIAELSKLIEDTGGSVEKFCRFAKVAKLGDIFEDKYQAAIDAVKKAAQARKKTK